MLERMKLKYFYCKEMASTTPRCTDVIHKMVTVQSRFIIAIIKKLS